MKRFFCLSIILHCVLLFLLLSWEFPRADKLLAWSKIQVTLIDAVEEKKDLPVPVPAAKEKAKRSRPVSKEPPPPPARTDEKKENPQPPPATREKAEERVAQPRPEPVPPRPAAAAKTEEVKENSHNAVNSPPPADSTPQSGGGGAFAMITSAGLEKAGIGMGADRLRPEKAHPSGKGEGSPPVVAGISPSREPDSILRQINRRIEAAKRYPRSARKMGIEGITTVRFKITPRGDVEGLEVVESSGSEILDRASLETVRAAAPLPYKEGWLRVGIVFKIL